MDFFFHERSEAALFSSCSIPFNVKALAFLGGAVIVSNEHFISGYRDDVIIVHLNGLLGVINKPRNIRA